MEIRLKNLRKIKTEMLSRTTLSYVPGIVILFPGGGGRGRTEGGGAEGQGRVQILFFLSKSNETSTLYIQIKAALRHAT